MSKISVRRAGLLDARPIAQLLNQIILQGGTTAMTREMTADDIRALMTVRPRNAWHLAEDDAGEVLGFQWIDQIDSLPPEAASIGTYARLGHTGLGIGSALFAATQKAARDLGYKWINADIRADNEGGLIYYQSRGFEDYGRKTGVQLDDGTQVEKVLKRFDL